jgi:hypothetical protein
MFDPYHRWLSIPKHQRPPTYYQLLGVAPDEADPQVITEAALRQTTHVRTYQTGPYAEACTKILNEIAQARATLLHPEKRRDYDARLAPVAIAPPPLPFVEVERVELPRPARSVLDGRAGLLVLLGAGCMLLAQLLVLGLLWLATLLARPRRSAPTDE